MKKYALLFLTMIFISACNQPKEMSSIHPENWSERKIKMPVLDSMEYGKSYLSIYSQIYSLSEHTTHNLTAMASLRNVSDRDTVYLLKAVYYDTHGNPIRTYFDEPIFLAPMETTEIIIDEIDVEGGTGSNFLFEWKTPKNCPEPLFEGIMNSTMGQQGLSFTTQSRRIE